MKNKKRHRRILFLMITSQVLLTVFVVQWLRSQYRAEKDRLTEELTMIYIDAQDEMIDTLLFRSYVSPVLRLSDDSSSNVNDRVRGIVRVEGNSRHIKVRFNQKSDSASLPDSTGLRRNKNYMLLRSVRLIISHTRDSVGDDMPAEKDFDITPDTSEFKSHFNKRLKNEGLRFNLIWDTDSAGNKDPKKTLYLAPVNPFSLPAVSVMKYKGYLAGQILPQVLFGLLLIFLTAMAFMLSYRSLRDHAIFNNLRNEFISNMTHELKTPVSAISVALEALSKYNLRNDPKTIDEYLTLALSETKRLEELVDRVLDHSVIEESHQSLSITDTDLNSLIKEAAATFQVKLKEKGKIDFSPAENGIMVKCDPLMFKGVIMNLLDNSIKYSNTVPEIKISAECGEGVARITITDNGPGIPAEYHDKIFEKFFRIPSGNVHNVKGYGLGLSFASLVMKLHNGTIAIRNIEKGCSFILTIPLA